MGQTIAQRGLAPDAIAAVLAERGLDLLTAILAIFKTGGVYLPLDPRHPPQRNGDILKQAELHWRSRRRVQVVAHPIAGR